MHFISCAIYLSLLGLCAFSLGRLLPKNSFHYEARPFCPFSWEQQGRFYEKLHIRFWQNKLPDMSRLFSWLMPEKRLSQENFAHLPRMLQETCVAEFMHLLLMVLGFYCVHLWRGPGGWILSLLYCCGNVPYIMIQRYNRPRLLRLLHKQEERKGHPSCVF